MNRKQRRAKESHNSSTKNADDIPLAQPDRRPSARSPKTLIEIAAEKQAQLDPSARKYNSQITPENIVQVEIGEDGNVIPNAALESLTGPVEPRDETPWLDAILLTSSLAAVHFTFEVLTVHQYAQELRFPPIFAHTVFTALPTLMVVVSLFRGLLLPISAKNFSKPAQRVIRFLQQCIYVGIANLAGCYLIYLTNDRGYYAVMKNAPAVATIWLWAILESGLVGALLGVIGPGLYGWWHGYGPLGSDTHDPGEVGGEAGTPKLGLSDIRHDHLEMSEKINISWDLRAIMSAQRLPWTLKLSLASKLPSKLGRQQSRFWIART
ncbi:hypothetical protein LTR84_010464 [Exophiala bonariae]|uniref:DUF7719 domain-containing protein n=1 Tax=Exophiala bonariae TaxID=1690606 RepID=A0AAV9MV48_9EURO|nr:hypothetical protein LTR84_010464 [Exophiala bonariae]